MIFGTFTATGQVFDETGQPLSSAAVRILERPTVGSITDINGRFNQAVLPGETLEVSFIGFKRFTFKPVQYIPQVVRMELDEMQLNEVVITGSPKKKRFPWALSLAALGAFLIFKKQS